MFGQDAELIESILRHSKKWLPEELNPSSGSHFLLRVYYSEGLKTLVQRTFETHLQCLYTNVTQ